MYNDVWGCAEILPDAVLQISDLRYELTFTINMRDRKIFFLEVTTKFAATVSSTVTVL